MNTPYGSLSLGRAPSPARSLLARLRQRDQGIIPGATLLTVPELGTLSSRLLENSEVVLYCS